MEDFENKSKRRTKRCKSAHPNLDNLSTDKKLLMKRKRPKSTGRNLDILDRKYLELREIVLESIAARLPMEKLLLTFAMHENKRLGQILKSKSSQLLPLDQSIQASRMYKKAFGDIQINKKAAKRNADVSRPLPPVFKSNSKICCCGTCKREDYKLIKRQKDLSQVSDENDINTKKRTNNKIPSFISRSVNSLTSFANVSNNSDTNEVRRSLASRPTSSKRQEPPDSGLHLMDDTYRWHNCNQEIRNWLKEKNKELRQKKREAIQLAKKEEEKAKQEKEMIEAQKLESREKVRAWLDQRRKKTKSTLKYTSKKFSTGESSTESINSASKEIINYENTSLGNAPTEINHDELNLASLEIFRQNSFEKIAKENNAVGKHDKETDHLNEEDPWRETCSKEVTGDKTNNSNDKNEPESNEHHISDFEKLLAGFSNSDEQGSIENHQAEQKLDKEADVSSLKDANEALIKHEIDLNQNGMVNEWLYDSGRLFEGSKVPEPGLQNINKRIESPKSLGRMTPLLDQNVNESRKSIKITHFDLLRDQTENGSQSGERIDLEQFKRLIIHDDNDAESNLNRKNLDVGNNDDHGTIDNDSRRRSFRRTSTAMAFEGEKLNEMSDKNNVMKLKRDFLKFDDSYRSPKKDATGVLFDDSLRDADVKSSLDGRPKTSRRRVQIEKKSEIVLE